jgi:aspartate aminotransferase-like enzyme
MRAGVEALGLPLFADPDYASNTVTAIAMPEGVSARALIQELQEKHGIVVASGQGKTADQMIRVGHMGWCDADDIDVVLDALAEAVPRVSRSGA